MLAEPVGFNPFVIQMWTFFVRCPIKMQIIRWTKHLQFRYFPVTSPQTQTHTHTHISMQKCTFSIRNNDFWIFNCWSTGNRKKWIVVVIEIWIFKLVYSDRHWRVILFWNNIFTQVASVISTGSWQCNWRDTISKWKSMQSPLAMKNAKNGLWNSGSLQSV